MANEQPGIFRGSVDGKQKYCRVLIRRKRASIEDAIRFFTSSVTDIDELCAELNEEETKEARFAQQCMVTAVDALKEYKGVNE